MLRCPVFEMPGCPVFEMSGCPVPRCPEAQYAEHPSPFATPHAPLAILQEAADERGWGRGARVGRPWLAIRSTDAGKRRGEAKRRTREKRSESANQRVGESASRRRYGARAWRGEMARTREATGYAKLSTWGRRMAMRRDARGERAPLMRKGTHGENDRLRGIGCPGKRPLIRKGPRWKNGWLCEKAFMAKKRTAMRNDASRGEQMARRRNAHQGTRSAVRRHSAASPFDAGQNSRSPDHTDSTGHRTSGATRFSSFPCPIGEKAAPGKKPGKISPSKFI